MHGRWPTVQYYKVGVDADGTLTAIQLRGYSGMGAVPQELRRDRPASSCTSARTSRPSCHPVYTNRTVSGNFRGPEYPQGFFGIQSMMDDVALPAEDRSGRVRAQEHDADVARRGAVHQLHARGVHPPRRGGVRLEDALAAAAGLGSRADQARRRHDLHGCSARGSGTSSAVLRARTRRATTRCSSASPTSAPARRRRWG